MDAGGEAEEGLEGGHWGTPAVEAEGELVEVGLEVIVSDAVVGTAEPGLEVAKDAMDVRQELGRSLGCGLPLRRQRRRIGHPGKPTSQILAPNDVWSADYKRQFRTGDGRYCYPLTVADGFSRYLLGCQALTSTAVEGAKPIFTRLFKEYGLPKRIRTDNGVPFATNTLARLSKLSAWWVRLGVLPELIEPGRPAQNGRHERMHRTLKAETTRPAASSLAAQQRRFNVFREEFNHERPHEALDQATPAACHAPSPRPMVDRLPPLEYPDRFEVRYVSANGGIRWNSR